MFHVFLKWSVMSCRKFAHVMLKKIFSHLRCTTNPDMWNDSLNVCSSSGHFGLAQTRMCPYSLKGKKSLCFVLWSCLWHESTSLCLTSTYSSLKLFHLMVSLDSPVDRERSVTIRNNIVYIFHVSAYLSSPFNKL